MAASRVPPPQPSPSGGEGVSDPSGRAYAARVSGRQGPPGLLRRWESLSTPVQGAIAFPPLAVVLFLLNLSGFNQPLARSIVYGVIEGAVVTALILVATANERRKRAGR
jgi:hypothetical protein